MNAASHSAPGGKWLIRTTSSTAFSTTTGTALLSRKVSSQYSHPANSDEQRPLLQEEEWIPMTMPGTKPGQSGSADDMQDSTYVEREWQDSKPLHSSVLAEMGFSRAASCASAPTEMSRIESAPNAILLRATRIECVFTSGLRLLDVYPALPKTVERMRDKLVEYVSDSEETRAAWPLCANILDPVRASVVCDGPSEILETVWLLYCFSLSLCLLDFCMCLALSSTPGL